MREEIKKIQALMEAADYVTDAPVATSVYLAMTLRKPLLILCHAGVGKTEAAKGVARVQGTKQIRHKCYEGLKQATALYEWNYPKQLLHIKLEEETGHSDRKSTRLNSSHGYISYAAFFFKKKVAILMQLEEDQIALFHQSMHPYSFFL